MRWLRALALLGLVCIPHPAHAAITFVNSSFGASTNGNGLSGAASMNTTGANFIACAIADYNANSPSTITESLHSSGPTGYTNAPNSTPALVQVRMAYWINYSGGNPTAFTTSGTTTYPAIACVALANVDTTGSAFEAQSAGGATSSGTTITPGSLTPAQANEVLVVVQGMNSDTSESINGGFGVNGSGPVTGGALPGTSFGASIAYLIQTSAAAANPTWTGAATTGRAAIQATFLCGNCGGGTTTANLTTTGAGR